MICTTIGPGILQWTIEPLLDREHRISFHIREHGPGSVLNSTIPEVTNVKIISAQPDPNMLTGNLTSVITNKVTNNNVGKHVYCGDGLRTEEDMPSLVIPGGCKSTNQTYLITHFHEYLIIALPSSPVLAYINITYSIAEYSAVLKWSSNGPEVANYTINFQQENGITYSVTVTKEVLDNILYLNYSTNYSVTAYATNCKGSGNSTSFTMFEGEQYKCSWQNYSMSSFSWLQCSSGSSEWKSWRV